MPINSLSIRRHVLEHQGRTLNAGVAVREHRDPPQVSEWRDRARPDAFVRTTDPRPVEPATIDATYEGRAATRLVRGSDGRAVGVKVTLAKPPPNVASSEHRLRTLDAAGNQYAQLDLGPSGLAQHDRTVTLPGGADARVVLERLEAGAVVERAFIPVAGRDTDATSPLALRR